MNDEEEKLNPDELLKAIQQQESNLGKLKIFFGMAAGVGKTYAMLQDGQEKLKEGINVVIGTINTHGREETEALIKGIPLIPEKWIKYKDTVFEEMDLEKILETKPDLVLVDELAHTNVPGSKHPKRWQDVIEILEAGIDVYTTVNVQHIESRKDLVESLTGIQVRETVPDSILEKATNIEVIDIPPPELLDRLHEGKVYLGDQSVLAAQNFFKEENLMALREIALRFTAEKVDHDLHGILKGKGWKTRERLLVAISPSPSSEQLIRAARRLAFELDAPWYAVHINTGKPLTGQEQARLNRYYNLARDLGATVIISEDRDIAEALQRIARQHDITRIIIGRPPKKKFALWNIFQGSFIDKLENDNKHIDIIILRQEKLTNIYERSLAFLEASAPWSDYGLVFIFIMCLTAIGFLINPFIGYKAVGFVFLLGILVLSFLVGRGPIFVAALLSAISWDFLFIPPLFSPTISDFEDIILVFTYFIIAAVIGMMASRLHEQDQLLRKREEKAEKLYDIEREILNSTTLVELRKNVCSRLENIFPGKFDILTENSEISIKEKPAVDWVLRNGKVGGWATDTLPSVEGLYFPIKLRNQILGVLAYFSKNKVPLTIEEMNFIETVTQQLAVHLYNWIKK